MGENYDKASPWGERREEKKTHLKAVLPLVSCYEFQKEILRQADGR